MKCDEIVACCVQLSCMSTGYKYTKYNIFSPRRVIISGKRKELEIEELAKLGKSKSHTACQMDLCFLPLAVSSAPGAVGSNLKDVPCWGEIRYIPFPHKDTIQPPFLLQNALLFNNSPGLPDSPFGALGYDHPRPKAGKERGPSLGVSNTQVHVCSPLEE